MDEEISKKIDSIEECLNYGKGLMEQFSSFSKEDETQKEIVNVGNYIKNIVIFCLHGSNLKPHFTIASNLWNIEIDVRQMKQVKLSKIFL